MTLWGTPFGERPPIYPDLLKVSAFFMNNSGLLTKKGVCGMKSDRKLKIKIKP